MRPPDNRGVRVVTNVGWDAVDAGCVGAHGEAQGGRRIEPNPVSEQRRARRTAHARVRQNRVVLAAVAAVKPCGGDIGPTGSMVVVNSQGDGDKQEFVAGEITA